MATSSKKNGTSMDILVRLGMLEKLVDHLMERVAKAEAIVQGSDSTVREVLSIVSKMQSQEDVWDTSPMPGKQDENPESPDDVSQMTS